MDVIGLNTLNPKTYGNLTLNKHIAKKHQNKHSHSRRNRIWKSCMEHRDTCRNPHKCRNIPRRRQLNQFIQKEVRMYITTKNTQNCVQSLLETTNKPERHVNTLNDNLVNGVYGEVSPRLQSNFIKYPFLQQLLPLLRPLNNWTMQSYRTFLDTAHSGWKYDTNRYKTWHIKIECVLKEEWLSRFQSMNPKLKMVRGIDKTAARQYKYRKNKSYYTKKIKSPKIIIQRLFEDSAIIRNCGSQALFHGIIRSIFGDVIVPREIVEILLKYCYNFLLEPLLPYNRRKLNEHHSLKYHYIRAGDLLSCHSIDDTMAISLAREWISMWHENQWKHRKGQSNDIYIGAMLKPWGEGENTVAYVDFVPIFKIGQVELIEQRKVKKRRSRKKYNNDEDEGPAVVPILQDYYHSHFWYTGYHWNVEEQEYKQELRIKLSDFEEKRLMGWNKNSDVLKYKKVRNELRYRKRRWTANYKM